MRETLVFLDTLHRKQPSVDCNTNCQYSQSQSQARKTCVLRYRHVDTEKITAGCLEQGYPGVTMHVETLFRLPFLLVEHNAIKITFAGPEQHSECTIFIGKYSPNSIFRHE